MLRFPLLRSEERKRDGGGLQGNSGKGRRPASEEMGQSGAQMIERLDVRTAPLIPTLEELQEASRIVFFVSFPSLQRPLAAPAPLCIPPSTCCDGSVPTRVCAQLVSRREQLARQPMHSLGR